MFTNGKFERRITTMKKRLLLILTGKDPYVISAEKGHDVTDIETFKSFVKSESQLPITSIDENTDAFIFTDEHGYLLATAVWQNYFLKV